MTIVASDPEAVSVTEVITSLFPPKERHGCERLLVQIA
jgi:hypothetical protein